MHILNKCFDKIYVISIKDNYSRKNLVNQQLLNIAYEFFDAAVPTDIVDIKQRHIIGNRLSHIRCLEQARNLGLSNVLVLEDDIIFDEAINYEHIMETIQPFIKNNTWSCLYLGGKSRNNLRKENNIFPFIKRANGMIGTHAISYNAQYYDTLINYLLEPKTLMCPIDYYFAGPRNCGFKGFCGTYNSCYTIYPKFILQRTGQNVRGCTISSNYWKDY